MVRCLLVLAVAAGCNQVYGLDATRLPADAPQFAVHGRLVHRWIENTSAGTPTIRELPLTSTSVVYLSLRTAGGVRDIAIGDDGTFTFSRDAEDAPYRLELALDGDIVELHGSAPEITYVVRTAGRLEPAPIDDRLLVRFPQAVNTVKGAVASTGVWSFSDANPAAGAYEMNWQAPKRATTRHGRVDASRGDVFYTLDYETRTAEKTYEALAGAERHVLTMDGQNVMLNAPPRIPASAQQQCGTLVGKMTDEIERLKAALAPEYFYVVDGWEISATGSLEIGATGNIELAAALYLGGDIAITPAIHNPIAGNPTVVSASTVFVRFLKHPAAASPTTLDAAIGHVSAYDCAAPQSVAIPEPSIALPVAMRLDGIELASDGAEVTPSADEIELTWEVTAGAPPDLYNVYLFEVLNIPAFDSTAIRPARMYQTAVPRVVVDLPTLVRGRYYVAQIAAVRGLPDARSGSLDRITYPFSVAQVSSSLFRIR